MSFEGTKRRVGWIALLVGICLLMTSWHAKLGVYHSRHSPSNLISKAFKPTKGSRLERFVPASPVVTSTTEKPAASRDEGHPEPDFPGYAPARPQALYLSRSHWTRPPPARS